MDHVRKVPVERRIKSLNVIHKFKNTSTKYSLLHSATNVNVCKQCFLKTLDNSQRLVEYMLLHATNGFAKPYERINHHPHNRTFLEILETGRSFIKLSPAVPSHYCRGSTSTLDLPTEMRKLSRLYLWYKLKYQGDSRNPQVKLASKGVFEDIFRKEFNIGFGFTVQKKINVQNVKSLITLQMMQRPNN